MGPTILAIETSCDETAAAVISGGNILANIVATQAVHERYGGVVPNWPRGRTSNIWFRLFLRH